MKPIMLIVTVFLASCVCLSNADECVGKGKVAKLAPLHHIIEFGKRSKVEGKGCKTPPVSKTSAGLILGVHNLLHARSQLKNKQNATEGKNNVSSPTFEKTKNEAGSKRTNAELHKLQLRAETISMLHSIVEKYFPGGHLTVDQKIKALKILGKLIKLKKEGKNEDIKKLLGALSIHEHKQSDGSNNNLDISKIKKKPVKTEESGKKDTTDQSGGDDIYANIASGPDVPKLPPSISGKDPDHAHSNIMPVGLRPLGGRGAGEMMSRITSPNDISDNLNDRISSYQAPLQGSVGLGQIYRNGNNFQGNGIGLSSIANMVDGQGYARSRMPYPRRRYSGRDWRNAGRRYYGDDDEDDDDEEDDDDDDDEFDDDDDREEDEQGRTRSNVHRHYFYDSDNDNNDDEDSYGEEVEYTRRFDRKDEIAKRPTKSGKKSLI